VEEEQLRVVVGVVAKQLLLEQPQQLQLKQQKDDKKRVCKSCGGVGSTPAEQKLVRE
jgi:hypothetical protein